jgi:hypothetical protein
VALVSIETASETLEELVCTAVCNDGRTLPDDTAARLLEVPARFIPQSIIPEAGPMPAFNASLARVMAAASARNEQWFMQESERLDRWAEDQRLLLKHRVDELDLEIRHAKRSLRQLDTLEEKARLKREIKRLEQQRDEAMLSYYENRKKIDQRQDELLDRVEAALRMQHRVEVLFDVSWTLAEGAP